jgi:hypothetical protein
VPVCLSEQELFNERHYGDLDGGILEGFGRLLKFDLKLYGGSRPSKQGCCGFGGMHAR